MRRTTSPLPAPQTASTCGPTHASSPNVIPAPAADAVSASDANTGYVPAHANCPRSTMPSTSGTISNIGKNPAMTAMASSRVVNTRRIGIGEDNSKSRSPR